MNKKENKVYVITSGEYSDYSIDRVFSTQQKALEYLDTKDDEYRVEVFDLDEPIERKTQIYEISFELDKKETLRVKIVGERYKDLIRVDDQCEIIDIHVESDSRERALKVASERYGAILANEQTMYPYLRFGVLRGYNLRHTAYFDFHTGELVLMDNHRLDVGLPPFIKVNDRTNHK